MEKYTNCILIFEINDIKLVTGRLKKYWIEMSIFVHILNILYNIGYYWGFHSSLRDKNWANGAHFGLLLNDDEQWYYNI